MSEIIRSIILGIIQGLTEFLPVSSSGHLELAKYLLGDDSLARESLMMTVMLHAATALSTMLVFRKDIALIFKGLFKFQPNEQTGFSLKIILSMIPAVIIGLVFEEQIAQLFNKQLLLVGSMLFITGLLLYFADRAINAGKEVGYKSAFLIGIAQAIAILPGISRSGATISSSLLLGIDREKAARFSFLMVVPLIFGKMAKDIISGELAQQDENLIPLLAGFIAAFISGALACIWMIKLVKNSKLIYFSVYCFIIAAIAIVVYLLN